MTEDYLSWSFSVKEEYSVDQGKYRLCLDRISEEFFQDKADYTPDELFEELKQAKDSLVANGSWSEVEIPEKIQYNKKINCVCSYYDLRKIFNTDPRIIKLDNKIIFTDSSKTAVSATYDCEKRKLVNSNIKQQYTRCCRHEI